MMCVIQIYDLNEGARMRQLHLMGTGYSYFCELGMERGVEIDDL